MSFEPLFRAIPAPRGCGHRLPGGLYVESGLGPGGQPLDHFLIDPPLPVPAGLDLVNKPQLLDDPTTGIPHLWIWVGAEWYPYCADFIEEVRQLGASRRINHHLDLKRLVPGSRLILVHPHALNTIWQDQRLPYTCYKHRQGHALVRTPQAQPTSSLPGWFADDVAADGATERPHNLLEAPSSSTAPPTPLTPSPRADPRVDAATDARDASDADVGATATAPVPTSAEESLVPPASIVPGWQQPATPSGPCLFKTYDLIPAEAATHPEPSLIEARVHYTRQIGSTTYLYAPSGEAADGLEPGVFAALPITGFALIRHSDGSVNEPAEAKLRAAELPYYTTDR